MSYAESNNKGKYLVYSIFGMVVIFCFFLVYAVKGAVLTFYSPSKQKDNKELGSIIPHVVSLKAGAFMVFPTYLEYVYYCYGYMLFEFPWASDTFG